MPPVRSFTTHPNGISRHNPRPFLPLRPAPLPSDTPSSSIQLLSQVPPIFRRNALPLRQPPVPMPPPSFQILSQAPPGFGEGRSRSKERSKSKSKERTPVRSISKEPTPNSESKEPAPAASTSVVPLPRAAVPLSTLPLPKAPGAMGPPPVPRAQARAPVTARAASTTSVSANGTSLSKDGNKGFSDGAPNGNSNPQLNGGSIKPGATRSRTSKAQGYPHPHASVKISPSNAGLGVYAQASFERADVIFAETPMFTAPRTSGTDDLVKRVRGLAQENLIKLLSMEAGSATGTTGIQAIFTANAIPCVEEDPESPEETAQTNAGVFRFASRINHSCSPSAGWFWCSVTESLLLIAARHIRPGDEITVSYAPTSVIRLPRSARRKALFESNAFHCVCRVCSAAPDVRKESDRRRKRLAVILAGWEAKGIDGCVAARETTLKEADEALNLAKDEGLIADLTDLWTQIYYVHAAWGEFEEAKRAAKKTRDAFARVRGRDAVARHWIGRRAQDPKEWERWGICLATQAAQRARRRM